MSSSRLEEIKAYFPALPAYRFNQIEEALFDTKAVSWNSITTLPKEMRNTLESVPFFAYKNFTVYINRKKNCYKAVLELLDGQKIETVIMENAKSNWTVCVSSQVGCPVGCNFCATGKMGLKRNLNVDEIIDQYRFWSNYLDKEKITGKISNIVFMGMGEPLLNYESIKDSINIILKYTKMGNTNITVSTVGIFFGLEKILVGKKWPHVRLAISLHSAILTKRQKMIKQTPVDFFERLEKWIRNYDQVYGNRTHKLTFEYIMLKGINDAKEDALALANYVGKFKEIKINLIPYNENSNELKSSADNKIIDFQQILKNKGLQAFIRKSFGKEIQAACGQLATKTQIDTKLLTK